MGSTEFSYIWLFALLVIHLLDFGGVIAKLGEPRDGDYNEWDFLIGMIVCILTGLALYWWPK